ncbi:carbohydrate ABC transporter permease [Eubacteriales bacterium mix99]
MAKRKRGYRPLAVKPQTNVILSILVSLFALFCFLPILLIYIGSFTAEKAIKINGFSFLPAKWSVSSYQYLFKDGGQILQSYWVSISLTIFGTVLSLLIMTLYAYAISREDFALRRQLTFFAYFTMLFNGGMVASYIVNTTVFGLRDSYWVLLLPTLCSAYNIIVLRTFFTSLGTESLIEAAKIDGAGELRIYARIILPISKPALATIGLFTAIAYFSKWFEVMLYIENSKLYTIQYLLQRVMKNLEFLRSNPEFAMSEGGVELLENLPGESMRMALTVLAMTPVLAFYPFFQKYFVKGLTLGSVKG